jgi:hypothetical protein
MARCAVASLDDLAQIIAGLRLSVGDHTGSDR